MHFYTSQIISFLLTTSIILSFILSQLSPIMHKIISPNLQATNVVKLVFVTLQQPPVLPVLSSKLSPDASPQKIANTLRLPSGVGATCVLKTPFNSTLDQLAQTLNPSANNSKTLAARYFDSMCLDSFTQGVPLSNFVPPPPSPAPSDDPDPRFEDRLWNFTAATLTTVRGKSLPGSGGKG